MTRYYLGLDTGGTKSHALVADESGRALGFGRGGPSNPHGVGYPHFYEVVCDIAGAALAQAGVGPDQIAGIGMGVGGYDWTCEHDITVAALSALKFSAPVHLVNDAYLGILAGTDEGWGVAVVSGTGSNCRGRDRQGREGRVTGHGVMLGEGAGASELVLHALQAIAKQWTRRGPSTRLTEAFQDLLGVDSTERLLEKVTRQENVLTGQEARLIFQIAEQGDPVALDLILFAADELASLACGVIRQLELESEPVPVVMVGGMWNGSPLLIRAFEDAVRVVAPKSKFVRLAAPPVIGAVMLGMEQGGLRPCLLRPLLVESAAEIIERRSAAAPGQN